MNLRPKLGGVFSVLLALLCAAAVTSWTSATAVAQTTGATRVYLFLGLGNVFSTGIDVLAEKLTRRHIWARAANHVSAGSFADDAIQAYRAKPGPIVLIGHSLGGDATVEVANKLRAAGVPVALLISYGPANVQAVPSNVARAINYYQSNSAWNATFRPGPGFKGALRNIDLAKDPVIDHLTIEKDDRLHAAAIAAIQALRSGGSVAQRSTGAATARGPHKSAKVSPAQQGGNSE
jgi:pimeloyl-ACP methyl ester carboxylesterase